MLPASYQTLFRNQLNEQPFLTLEIVLLCIPAHRQVRLSTLVSLCSQPIQYQSRKRNLQRFLLLPKLGIKWLWFPLVRLWISPAETNDHRNREQRRYLNKHKHQTSGDWLPAMERTQWQGRNVLRLTLVWGTHTLSFYWSLMKQPENSDLRLQKRLLKVALSRFKDTPVLVLGDREFHSPKLAQWLDERGACCARRQKTDLHFQPHKGEDYRVLKDQGFKPEMAHFYLGAYL